MIPDPKIIKLEDMAESARAIVEEGKDDDEFSTNSNDSGRQSSVRQIKIKDKKKLKAAKMSGFKKELLRLCN